MNSKTIDRFWKSYSQLPDEVKKKAKETYKLFSINPYHPSLNFKQVHSSKPVFSVRISKDYRAVGILNENDIIWFWIGSHSEYDKLLNQLKNN